VKEAFDKELKSLKTGRKVVLKYTGCPGFCEKGPLVTLHPQDLFYQRVKPEDVPRIVTETILGGKVIEDLLLEDPAGPANRFSPPGRFPSTAHRCGSCWGITNSSTLPRSKTP